MFIPELQGTGHKIMFGLTMAACTVAICAGIAFVATLAIGHFATASNLLQNAKLACALSIRTSLIATGIGFIARGIFEAQRNDHQLIRNKLIKTIIIVAGTLLGLSALGIGIPAFISYFATSNPLIHYSNIICNISVNISCGALGASTIGGIGIGIYYLLHRKEWKELEEAEKAIS